MKKILFILFAFLVVKTSFAQKYEFTPVKDISVSSVKNQGNTGTCWSFSTSSFVESEIKRISGMAIDISEMYFVRNTYTVKAWDYVMRQGHAQFSQGGLAHDVNNAIKKVTIKKVQQLGKQL